MIRRILTVLTAICLVVPVLGLPLYAQERQVGNRTPIGNRSPENRQAMDMAEVEKMRGDLISVYAEGEALVRFLAGYEFIRQSYALEDYESALQQLSNERVRVEQMPPLEVIAQVSRWPEEASLSRIVEVMRSVRTDAKLLEVFQKAERYAQAGLMPRVTPAANENGLGGVIAAPAYIAPTCNFDDPSNYPSGADIAISNGIALALHTLADALPDMLVFLIASVPNVIKIVLVIAAGVVDQVTNALTALKTNGGYCETIRFYVEDVMGADAGLTTILATNDFYLTFSLRSVRAALAKATSTGVTTNCGSTRLAEAQAFFNGSDSFIGTGPQRVEAYKKLRAAYQNIGASACVQ